MQAPIANARSSRPFAERHERALRIATVVLCVIVPGYLVASALRQQSSTPVSVHEVANAGVLVKMVGVRVLIDGPIREGIPPYATSSAQERTRLERAQPPYADVDAILLTHWHEDHFSAEAVAAHLASNRRAVLVLSPEVVARVRAVAPALDVTRLREVLPAPGASERVNVGALTVRVLRVRHNPTRRLPQQHVAFLLGDGPAVLHTGDADPAADNFTLLRDLPAVDVALVPFWYVLDASGRALVRQALAPREKAYGALTDQTATQMITGPRGSRSRAGGGIPAAHAENFAAPGVQRLPPAAAGHLFATPLRRALGTTVAVAVTHRRADNMPRKWITVDGNEAAASVAHRTNDVIAIYPITPSSTMGELSDAWAARGVQNIWGQVPSITEMQSEGGAIGAVHGALQSGSLATTFTSSQGLLLMIPNLYKIAGELTSFCMHVAARTVATHALSIFGDHSDVMACRQTGVALLSSASVQEAQDFALIGQAATLASRVPFIHFFDGFRTSHEVSKIQPLSDDDLRALIPPDLVLAHRQRALTPDHPVLRGTAQNPDTYFQAREASAPFYAACPSIVQQTMDAFAERTGRQYGLFEYVGHPEADRVTVLMGSAAETVEEAVTWLVGQGQRVGVLKVRLYRPFPVADFARALPPTTRAIAVLDRTKEPGAVGEPLYQDVLTALCEARSEGISKLEALPTIVGGRYGLSSKEFTPAMACAVFEELGKAAPKNHFTIGIVDDVSHSSLEWNRDLDIEPADVSRSVFFGLGADGTVGANKNSIKIIGEETDGFAQGYFVYDSKKSGAVTISHLRFGPRPIRSPYLVKQAGFVGCHQFGFLDRYDVLSYAAPGAVLLVNSPYPSDTVWDALPHEVQAGIIAKGLKLHVIDAVAVAQANGMGHRINTVMQTCFFALSGVLPRDRAIEHIKHAIEKTYARRGPEVVQSNFAAVDNTLQHLRAVTVPPTATSRVYRSATVSKAAPDFVTRVSAVMLAGQGDLLPVSAFPVDGTWPTGTSQWEKRNIALNIPVWDAHLCIQCNKCAFVCPHAAIRAKIYPPELVAGAPETFKSIEFKTREYGQGMAYTIQVAPEDCTGCSLCVEVCPAKDKSNPRHKAIDMSPQAPLRAPERDNYAFFLDLPEADRTRVKLDLKGTQLLQPLFEYSGACAGCGETPYIKLMTQLFGDRLLVANATGCSSIYGGNLPTTPYAKNADGRGPAWANSLFEDNAEFGLGMRLSIDQHVGTARALLESLRSRVSDELCDALLSAAQGDDGAIAGQRRNVSALRTRLAAIDTPEARQLEALADYLVRKSVWIVGGDGWAYDIGFGGLDHVLAVGKDVNILVLDTEVYSNTGGQQSKATPIGAAAKFAVAGKGTFKKDLAAMAMSYGHVYVARIAFGARDAHTVRVLQDAEAYPGPSLVIAYSPCIAHGYDLEHSLDQQKLAIESGYWPLYRFDPRLEAAGGNPFVLDSGAPKVSLGKFVRNETRFRLVEQQDPDRFRALLEQGQADIQRHFSAYEERSKQGRPPQT